MDGFQRGGTAIHGNEDTCYDVDAEGNPTGNYDTASTKHTTNPAMARSLPDERPGAPDFFVTGLGRSFLHPEICHSRCSGSEYSPSRVDMVSNLFFGAGTPVPWETK